MSAQVTPWPHEAPPTRAQLEAALRAAVQPEARSGGSGWEMGAEPPIHCWSNGPGDRYARHSHTYHKVLFCVEGSIRFLVGEAEEPFDVAPGDRLDLPPGRPHSAMVGPSGVTCLEAART
jgi:mannose-6-phosphate isomerase-like protein (cupin superfamily)